MESLCYADDNALCTNSPTEMNSNLEAVGAFCDQTGMRLNIKKSACFNIIPCGSKTYTVNLQVKPSASEVRRSPSYLRMAA